mgnify:CR=1 FL=1
MVDLVTSILVISCGYESKDENVWIDTMSHIMMVSVCAVCLCGVCVWLSLQQREGGNELLGD